MLCCLCLEETLCCLDIFETHNSSLNNLAAIISKHFWFELSENPFKSQFICNQCWAIVKSFHEFYIKVQQAHTIIEPNLIIKTESLLDSTKIDDIIKRETYQDSLSNNSNFEEENEASVISAEDNDEIISEDKKEKSSYHNESLLIRKSKRSTQQTKFKRNSKVEDTKKLQKKCRNQISERSLLSIQYDKKVSNFMTLVCDICPAVLATFGKLKTHFLKEHNTNGYALCCNKKYYKRNLLIDHIDTHLNPEHFKCPTCGKTFTNKESHQTHLKTFHLAERIVYACDECPKTFSWRYVLVAHKKTHAPKEEWKYKCNACDKTFASHTFLSSHNHYVHKVTKKICDLCGKSVSNTLFRKHQLTHTVINQPKVQCEICGSWLNKKYIKIHLRNHEESGSDHICVHCGKKSPNSKALYKHIYEVHTLKKTLNCNVCDKKFKSKDLLSQHMPVHTGENNFLCPYCPRTFKFKSNQHDHKKKEHPTEVEEDRQRRLKKNPIKF